MSHFCKGVPLILVCTKIDLRNDPTTESLMAAQGTRPISAAEGEKAAKEIGASGYLECSAKKGVGVQEVFDEALRLSFGKGFKSLVKAKRSPKCVVL